MSSKLVVSVKPVFPVDLVVEGIIVEVKMSAIFVVSIIVDSAIDVDATVDILATGPTDSEPVVAIMVVVAVFELIFSDEI
jgi:hypothetical protein